MTFFIWILLVGTTPNKHESCTTYYNFWMQIESMLLLFSLPMYCGPSTNLTGRVFVVSCFVVLNSTALFILRESRPTYIILNI